MIPDWFPLPIRSAQNSFSSVQQKHLDKRIFDQQVVDFVQKTSTVSFMRYRSNPLGHDCS